MIAFIIPIRHPANARSYSRVEALLEETLASLLNTASDDYRVIVVCSRTPRFAEPHPKVEFLTVDFPPPGAGQGSAQPAIAMRQDKGMKILAGCLQARARGARHIMYVDGDDFVHRDLAGFCNADPGAAGWRVATGLMYRDGGAIVSDLDDFNSYCGTSIILSVDLLRPFIGDALAPASPHAEILAKADMEFVRFVLGSHSKAAGFFAARGHPLARVPFAAAVWRAGSDESRSGIKFVGAPRIATAAEIAAFKLPIASGPARRVRAALTELPLFAAKHAVRKYVLGKK
jgi:hypothetical protein